MPLSFEQQDLWEAWSRLGNDGGGMLAWAVFGVQSLDYVVAADDAAFMEGRMYGSDPDVVDIAHVTAATALACGTVDRCVAALTRLYGAPNARVEAAMRWYEAPNAPVRRHVPARALAWIDGVAADVEYRAVRAARNPLNHALIQRAMVRPQRVAHSTRVAFAGVAARDLILTSRRVATSTVDGLAARVLAGLLPRA